VKSLFLSLAVATLVLVPVGSHTQQSADPSKPVLKANTRLVVVDVVATDSEGRPVSGLEAQDFTVLEDGRPQNVSGFSFQQPGTRITEVALRLPPGVVSNVPQHKATSLNVVLLDTMNGDFAGHAAAQAALVRYLASAQLAQPLAIFVMGDKLTMLHDFSTDGQSLKSAAMRFKPPAPRGSTETVQTVATPFTNKGDFHTDDRKIESTLAQLHALARTLSRYPGRKNVIWLSEAFPLDLVPEAAVRDSVSLASVDWQSLGGTKGRKGPVSVPMAFDNLRDARTNHDFGELVQKLVDAMMGAQVALYPVDSAGLGKDDHLASLHTMSDMAYGTGGRAFYNRNDLEVSLRTSLEDGSTYYTLSYYPGNKQWDGKFRVISIKANRPGVTLRYRLGYYALDPDVAAKDELKKTVDDFGHALEMDAPSVSAVQFRATVVPPSEKTQGMVVVKFAIDPNTLRFENQDGLEHAAVTCAVWAYSGKGNPVRSEGTSNAAIKPDVFQQVMESIYPCQRTMSLKPGKYTLRLGVLDNISNQFGTTMSEITLP
jgi:VWFA-related protein